MIHFVVQLGPPVALYKLVRPIFSASERECAKYAKEKRAGMMCERILTLSNKKGMRKYNFSSIVGWCVCRSGDLA